MSSNGMNFDVNSRDEEYCPDFCDKLRSQYRCERGLMLLKDD